MTANRETEKDKKIGCRVDLQEYSAVTYYVHISNVPPPSNRVKAWGLSTQCFRIQGTQNLNYGTN